MSASAWMTRAEQPRAPTLVVAEGDAALRLAERLLRLDADAFDALRAAVSEGMLVVRAPEGAAPWVDGASFFAACTSAPELYFETHRAPRFAAPLLVASLRERFGDVFPAALDLNGRLISLRGLERIDRDHLARWAPAE